MPVYLAPKSEWTKDGRKYFFKLQYFDPLEQKAKSFKSKKYLKKAEADNEEKMFIVRHKGKIKIKFDTIAQLFLEEKYKTRKESTGYSYEDDYNRHIKPYFENLYIDSINTQTINEWKLKMDVNNRSLKYLNGFYNILKGIFDFASNYGLEKNPAKLAGQFERRQDEVITDEEKLRYITYDQFQTFISVIKDITDYTLFTLFYFTGMRKGEVQALNWHDIDFTNNQIIVNKTLSRKTKDLKGYKITTTKNYKNRKVAMNKRLREQLMEYKHEMMKYSDFNEDWFVFGNSEYYASTTMDTHKNEYFMESEIDSITVHEFRHSHVSLLINQYIENCAKNHQEIDTAYFFLMVANRIGDTVETMQRVYLHLFPTMQKPIVNLLDNL